MDEKALEQVLHAEVKGKEAVKVLVGMMEASEDEEENVVERVGRVVTAEVCGGATPHWEKEEVFSILAEIFLFDETFEVPFEPDSACVSLKLPEENEEDAEDGWTSREDKLKEVLSEVAQCDPSCFELRCSGTEAVVTVVKPAVVTVVKPPPPPEVDTWRAEGQEEQGVESEQKGGEDASGEQKSTEAAETDADNTETDADMMLTTGGDNTETDASAPA
eukprot:1107362-Rhodomonas_salina.2